MAKKMLFFERVRRCKYCGSDMTDTVSSQSYLENPFCNGCWDERVSKYPLGPGEWRAVPGTDGKYIEWVPADA